MKKNLIGSCVALVLLTVYAVAVLIPSFTEAQISAGTINAKESGTWTVQPGNTANTTAWLTTGTGGLFPASQSGTWTVQPGNTPNTTAWLVTGTGGTFPTVPAALTAILTGQQAVTSTATLLPANAGKQVCIKVLLAGTQTVYFGPATVTAANGQEISAGDSWCGPLDNTNRIQVIAAGSGSTVAWAVLN